MTNLYCYFVIMGKLNGEERVSPFPPTRMYPPQIGAKVFIEGAADVYEVVDVQYQFSIVMPRELKLVNVVLRIVG